MGRGIRYLGKEMAAFICSDHVLDARLAHRMFIVSYHCNI